MGTKEILWVLRDTVGTKDISDIRLFTRDVFSANSILKPCI